MTDSNWSPLDHQIYRELKVLKMAGQKCLLMISGGADSVALLAIFRKLQSALQCELEVLHCHHGPTSPEQLQFRDEAQAFVAKLCAEIKIPFHTVRSESELKSEEALRDFRKSAARKIAEKLKCQRIVWAHHQNDFVETQFLRLIRGTGPQALMEPMTLSRGVDLRPLLKVSREEIVAYLKHQNLEWIEDPSNEDESYLRNWLRQTWLPLLEQKCPGALKSFARSLDLIQESWIETLPSEIWFKEGISRPIFLTLSEAQKKQVLALYLNRLGQREFTHNQLKEILKHLDISPSNHTFKTAHLIWSLSKDLISARSPFVVNANEGCYD